MNKEISGILVTKNDVFYFREDLNSDGGYVGWSIYDTSHRPRHHSWKTLPKGEVEFFDGDNPPPTVRYLPVLK